MWKTTTTTTTTKHTHIKKHLIFGKVNYIFNGKTDKQKRNVVDGRWFQLYVSHVKRSLLTKYQFFTKWPQISHHNFKSFIRPWCTNCFVPMKLVAGTCKEPTWFWLFVCVFVLFVCLFVCLFHFWQLWALNNVKNNRFYFQCLDLSYSFRQPVWWQKLQRRWMYSRNRNST